MQQSKLINVANGIKEAEGWYYPGQSPDYPNGSQSYRNHNPGNLRASIFAVGDNNGFAVFQDDTIGLYAIVHQLYLYASGHSSVVAPVESIGDAVRRYNGTLPGSKDGETYIEIVERIGGVNRNDHVSTLIT